MHLEVVARSHPRKYGVSAGGTLGMPPTRHLVAALKLVPSQPSASRGVYADAYIYLNFSGGNTTPCPDLQVRPGSNDEIFGTAAHCEEFQTWTLRLLLHKHDVIHPEVLPCAHQELNLLHGRGVQRGGTAGCC